MPICSLLNYGLESLSKAFLEELQNSEILKTTSKAEWPDSF